MILALPAVACLIVFKYIPIMGLQIAFKDFSFRAGIWDSPWVGFKHFDQMIHDVTIVPAIINTLGISFFKLIVCFPIPIIFALLLNEVRSVRYKKVVQTVSYFPHFIAYSVVALMLSVLLSTTGPVNSGMTALGLRENPYLFLGEPNSFWGVVVITEVWKTTGWSSIIYFAALTSISPELYEAATVDGAGRFRKMINITLPGIKPTIVMLLILNTGKLVNGANFDLSYLLGNPLNIIRSEILPTYVLRTGIGYGRFSYAAAVGFVQAFVSLVLVFSANTVAKWVSGEGLF
jgi:putative aldouronate transport system permease protein